MEYTANHSVAIFQAANVNHSRLQISWTICISFTRSLIIIQPLARIYEFGYFSQKLFANGLFLICILCKTFKEQKKAANFFKFTTREQSLSNRTTHSLWAAFQKLLINDKKKGTKKPLLTDYS